MTNQIKSKKRVSKYGEVFTADREVNAMLDLVKPETERVYSKFLDPACGNGNFLAEILRRKLKSAKQNAVTANMKEHFQSEYEKQSLIAVSSIYGIELLQDNVEECRKRLFDLWENEYTEICKDRINPDCRDAVLGIIEKNIICGNFLTMMCVDENGIDTDECIVFSEWYFTSDSKIQKKEYPLDKLLAGVFE